MLIHSTMLPLKSVFAFEIAIELRYVVVVILKGNHVGDRKTRLYGLQSVLTIEYFSFQNFRPIRAIRNQFLHIFIIQFGV